MNNIQLSAHDVTTLKASHTEAEEVSWLDLNIKTADENMRVIGFFRGDNRFLAREYAEAIAAVNARHPDASRIASEEAA